MSHRMRSIVELHIPAGRASRLPLVLYSLLISLLGCPSAWAAPVETGGVVDGGGPSGTLTIGSGTPGTYFDEDTSLSRDAIVVGADANGDFRMTASALTPTSPPGVTANSIVVGRDAGVTGEMEFGHSLSGTAHHIAVDCIHVGVEGTGTLTFGDETHVIWKNASAGSCSSPRVAVGAASGSDGTLVVKDTGEALLSGISWDAGTRGTGEIRVESGARAMGKTLKLGGYGVGSLIVDGQFSRFYASLFVEVGTAYGTGTIEVRNQGLYEGAAGIGLGAMDRFGTSDSRVDVNTGGDVSVGFINIFCGQVLVTGSGSTFTAGTFQLTCAIMRSHSGKSGGITIEDGGVVTATTAAILTGYQGGESVATVTGTGSLLDLTSATRDLKITHADLDDTYLPDATTTLNIEDGGRVQAVEAVQIGETTAVFAYPTAFVDLCTGGALAGSSVVVNATGSLAGGGVVEGNLVNDGIIEPGCATDSLEIQGDFEQGAAGVLRMEIAADDDYDVLSVTGDVDLDGTIEVTFLNGYSPPTGASYPLFYTAGATTLAPGLAVVVTNQGLPQYGTEWTIQFVPEPSSSMLTAAALLCLSALKTARSRVVGELRA